MNAFVYVFHHFKNPPVNLFLHIANDIFSENTTDIRTFTLTIFVQCGILYIFHKLNVAVLCKISIVSKLKMTYNISTDKVILSRRRR